MEVSASATLKGTPGAMKLGDGLSNVVTGMGQGGDRHIFNRWTFGAFGSGLDTAEIEAAYRTSWLVRKLHDLIPAEMTNAWRIWSLEAAVLQKITEEEERLHLREHCFHSLRLGALRGGAALVMGLPGASDTPAPPPEKVGPGELRFLLPFTRDRLVAEPIILDMDHELFGQPEFFTLNGNTGVTQRIHPSRVIVFPGEPSSGLILASGLESFWGHPLLESLNEAVQNSTLVQNTIAQLLPEAKVDILGIPGLTELVSTAAGETRLSRRIQAAGSLKSLYNVLVTDAGSGLGDGSGETWETRQINWAGLPEVGRFMLQVVAGARDIPLTRLIGAPPQGMNATGQHDEENFLKKIRADQGTKLRPKLRLLDPYLKASAGIPQDAKWDFAPLASLSPEGQADRDNVVADTLVILKQGGFFQEDALAEVALAVFDESPNFPGLSEAVAKSSRPLPIVTEAEAAATAAEATNQATLAKTTPPVSGVSSRPPRAGAGGSRSRLAKAANDASPEEKRKTAKAMREARAVRRDSLVTVPRSEIIADAAPRTLCIGRKVMNPQEVLNHFRAQGVENLVAAGDLHVTVVYSREPVEWMKLPADWSSDQDGKVRIAPGGPRAIELFGPESDTLVQAFQSRELEWRNEALQEAGCSSDWPDYQPHITIAEDVPAGFDISNLKPYTGRIVLGPEIWQQVKDPDDDGDQDTPEFESAELDA